MVKGVEEFGAKFQLDSFRHIKVLAQRQVCGPLSWPFKNILASVAEAAVRAIGNRKVVYVEPQKWTGVWQMAITDLVGALQSRRVRIAWIKADLRREGEARTQRDNSTEMPAPKHLIHHTTLIQECFSFSDR